MDLNKDFREAMDEFTNEDWLNKKISDIESVHIYLSDNIHRMQEQLNKNAAKIEMIKLLLGQLEEE